MANKKNKEVLVEVKNLKKYFKVGRDSYVQAVDNVSFDIYKGETLGLVGESGCGKTTCGKTVLGLYDATDGEVLYEGVDVHGLDKHEKKDFSKKAQIIFQDPYSSLNPRMTVGDIIGEGLDIHDIAHGKEREQMILDLLRTVGLNKEHISRFAHEFSGGQRQRIGIARALAIEPEFIVADEPISALDVSIQAQVVNLLMDLQREKGLTYLFIAHDLSMVKYISDRVGVMYLGQIVELTESDELYSNPLHPYTQALMSAIPVADPKIEAEKTVIPIEGEIPSPINPPSGCRFRTRCRYAEEICKEQPEFREVKEGHFVACHLVGTGKIKKDF